MQLRHHDFSPISLDEIKERCCGVFLAGVRMQFFLSSVEVKNAEAALRMDHLSLGMVAVIFLVVPFYLTLCYTGVDCQRKAGKLSVLLFLRD